MFWMRNKENNFPIRTHIWRPAAGNVDMVNGSVVRLLDYHNRSSKIIGQEVLIDNRL